MGIENVERLKPASWPSEEKKVVLNDLQLRVKKETRRDPKIEKYPPLVSLDHAIEVALEKIEEWDYTEDPHGWCHDRPILLTLVNESMTHQPSDELKKAVKNIIKGHRSEYLAGGAMYTDQDDIDILLREFNLVLCPECEGKAYIAAHEPKNEKYGGGYGRNCPVCKGEGVLNGS